MNVYSIGELNGKEWDTRIRFLVQQRDDVHSWEGLYGWRQRGESGACAERCDAMRYDTMESAEPELE